MKKILCAIVLVIAICTSALAADPRDALSVKDDESVYITLGLSNAGNLARWILSDENIDAFMPLILASEQSNEIIGYIELVRGLTQNMPLKSIALVAGVNKSTPNDPFLQAAFTVADELAPVVNKIKEGTAKADDIAKLLLGSDSPMIAFAETMIKADADSEKVYTIDNVIKLKAVEDLIVLGVSDNDLQASLKALNDADSRLFTKLERKFNTEDFIITHLDFETLKTLDEEDLKDVAKYLSKPVNIELAFKRVPDKFTMSLALNLNEAVSKEYAAQVFQNVVTPVKGSNVNLELIGGSASPLFIAAGILNMAGFYSQDDLKESIQNGAKMLEAVTGITEAELFSILNGKFSIAINDSINFQGFKIPALYTSFKGEEGAPAKVFEKLASSKFFSRIQEKVLQLDSSISPVSVLAMNKDDAFELDIADLTSLNETPQPSDKLAELLNREGVSVFWLDFAGIQSWIADNKVIETLSPMAKMFGMGKVVDYATSVLSAKFSVPSFAIWGENDETVHFEFNIVEDVAPEDGVLTRIVKICKDYMPKPEPESPAAPEEAAK